MTILTSEQIDAMRRIRHQLGAHSVAAHDIGQGTVWLTMWREDDDTPVFSGPVSPAGTIFPTTAAHRSRSAA